MPPSACGERASAPNAQAQVPVPSLPTIVVERWFWSPRVSTAYGSCRRPGSGVKREARTRVGPDICTVSLAQPVAPACPCQHRERQRTPHLSGRTPGPLRKEDRPSAECSECGAPAFACAPEYSQYSTRHFQRANLGRHGGLSAPMRRCCQTRGAGSSSTRVLSTDVDGCTGSLRRVCAPNSLGVCV